MTRSETKDLHQKLASRYSTKWRQGYTHCKLDTDPLYDAVFRQLKGSEHEVLDIGCGLGILAFYLRERGFQPAITGVDYDAPKIEEAQAAAADSGDETLSFHCCDARDARPEFQGSVTILDMLQFMPVESRAELLRWAASLVTPGGLLVIRSGLRDNSWRFRITRWADFIANWTTWMKDPPVSYPTESEFRDVLEPEGLEGEFEPLWGRNSVQQLSHRLSAAIGPQCSLAFGKRE